MRWVPDDIVSQLVAAGPEKCPYCLAHPSIPCVIHRVDEKRSEA
jgi:hypothetical protein